MQIAKGTPAKVVNAAERLLRQYNRGEIAPRQLYSGRGECLSVGLRYRLLRRNGIWALMTHESYNKYAKGRRGLNG